MLSSILPGYRLASAEAFAPPSLPPAAPQPSQTVPKPGPELCQLVTDWRAGRMPMGGMILEEKHDGIRALWLNGRLVSRAGAPLWATEGWWSAIAEIEARFGEPMMMDAEWVEPSGFWATTEAFQQGARVEAKGALHIFDTIPMRVWRGEAHSLPLADRRARLDAVLASNCPAFIRRVPWQRVYTDAAVQAAAAAVWARGGEGVVVKDPRAPYELRRSASWVRLKRSLTLDCRVISVEPMKDADDLAGALVVDCDGKAVRIPLNGWRELDRWRLWQERASLVGRIAEVAAMERTDKGALRNARFLRWRNDLERK